MYSTKPITIIMTIRTTPYYLITKIFFPKNVIKHKLNISSNMPINMNKYITCF